MSFSLFSPRSGQRMTVRLDRAPRPASLATVCALAVLLSATGHAVGLNDTGQTLCYDAAGTVIACTDPAAHDDGRYGRDAAASAGVLTKIGGGAAGFDFTKIANNGSTLAAGAALGAAAGDWACTRDNVTGLTWEVKTDDAGLRDKDWIYTWYNTDGTTNGGEEGWQSCGGTLAFCNTQAYITAALCGYSDWRLPSLRELITIVHEGVPNPTGNTNTPTIDTTYFPNTLVVLSSASTYFPGPGNVWGVSFHLGNVVMYGKTIPSSAHLVRGGPF